MYGFIGIEFWGGKSFPEFKKYFAKRIRPSEIKDAYEYVKAKYKELGYKEVKKKESKEGEV